MSKFNIDVMSRCVEFLVPLLEGLKTTISVTCPGAYREDASYAQVHLETELTEKKLEEWMDEVNASQYEKNKRDGLNKRGEPSHPIIDYIGITELNDHANVCRTSTWQDIWRAEGLIK